MSSNTTTTDAQQMALAKLKGRAIQGVAAGGGIAVGSAVTDLALAGAAEAATTVATAAAESVISILLCYCQLCCVIAMAPTALSNGCAIDYIDSWFGSCPSAGPPNIFCKLVYASCQPCQGDSTCW